MGKGRNSIIVGSALMASAVAFTGWFESGPQGSRLEAYQDQGGVWTICDGITKGIKPGMRVTQEWCDKALMEVIQSHSAPLDRVPYQMNDEARLAWADIMVNLGGSIASDKSTPWRRLIGGDWHGSCDAFLMYRYTRVGTEKRDCSRPASKCGGIWTRRNAQRDLCQGRITVDEFIRTVRGTPMNQTGVTYE